VLICIALVREKNCTAREALNSTTSLFASARGTVAHPKELQGAGQELLLRPKYVEKKAANCAITCNGRLRFRESRPSRLVDSVTGKKGWVYVSSICSGRSDCQGRQEIGSTRSAQLVRAILRYSVCSSYVL
jgi:hypothetical protein